MKEGRLHLVSVWFRATVLPAALLAGLSASAPASAQDYSARDVGGWTVAASKDGRGCFLTRTYTGTGGTTLLLGLDVDGGNRVSVLNDNWSIQPKERWKLTFKLTSGGYPGHPVVGMASDGKKGFVTSFDAKFPSHFAASKAMHIYRGTVPVEQLPLDGSGAAVAELRRCVGMHAAKPAAGGQEKGRSDRMPKDPFAADATRRSGE
jgi:hypothetical protein